MRRLMAFLAVLIGLSAILVASPAYATLYCQTTTICFYDTGISPVPFHNRDAFDAVRNVCYGVSPAITSYIKNTADQRWYVFQDGGCQGLPGTIYPHSQGFMNGVWNNNINSYYRTSMTS